MAVNGFNRFKERFEPYSDNFCIIGGSACDLLFNEYGLSFRRTKDLDIVVIVESPFEGFARELWDFVLEGEYTFGWRNDEVAKYYRFSEPKVDGFPFMIELFARHPDFRLEDEESEIAPLPISDDVSSLSAILLDDDYYAFLKEGVRYVEGMGVVDALYLVPLKAKAHIDLARRKSEGQHVNSADLKKHKRDVLRLTTIIPLDARIEVSSNIASDIEAFLEMIEDEEIRTDQLGIDKSLDELIAEIRSHYAQSI